MIAIGADHGGYGLKEEIKKYFDEKEIKYKDYGCFSADRVDYPDIAKKYQNQYKAKNVKKEYLFVDQVMEWQW